MINPYDVAYARYLQTIFETGETVGDRTGTGTIESFGVMADYGKISSEAFPLLTCKQTPFKSVLSELLWFIEGSTDERRLAEILFGKPRTELADKQTIWTANAKADYWKNGKFEGDLGNVYGKMWRSWPAFEGYTRRVHGIVCGTNYENKPLDQLDRVIESLKRDPHSRRHLIVAWNPGEQTSDKVALPPCHYAFQFNVNSNKELSLLVSMRSNDAMLGAPFNIASYALLQLTVAQVTGLKPGQLKFSIGSAHIYNNHVDGAMETIRRVANHEVFTPPRLLIDPDIKNIDDFKMSSFRMENYKPSPKIPLPMAT